MTSRKAAGLFFALPIVLCLSLGTAAAQDSGTTVVKQPAATTTPRHHAALAAGPDRAARPAKAGSWQ